MPVEVPRSLWATYYGYTKYPDRGHLCEDGDPEAAELIAPAGTVYDENEAKRLGIVEYLEAHQPQAPLTPGKAPSEEKAVEQSTVEDKAVAGPEESKAPEPTPPPEPTDAPEQPPVTPRAGGRPRGSA